MDYDGYIVTSRPNSAAKGSGTRFWFRGAEILFRRWPLYLLPIILLCGIGFLQAKKTAVNCQSVGTLNATSNPFVSTPSSATTSFNNWETPASAMSRRINELLSTDKFMGTVATTAGLKGAIDSKAITYDDMRKSVYATPGGDTVLRVVTTWGDATTAYQLADATISGYLDYVKETVSTDSSDAVTFYQGLAKEAQKKVDVAQDNVDAFVDKIGTLPVGVDINTAQQLQLEGLNTKLATAQAQLDDANSAIQAAQLDVQKSQSQAGQVLRVVDPPEVPTDPASTKKQKVVTLVLFAILGFLIAGVAVIVSTLLDATVRSAADVVPSGLVVVATVPVVRILAQRRKRSSSATPGGKRRHKTAGALAAR